MTDLLKIRGFLLVCETVWISMICRLWTRIVTITISIVIRVRKPLIRHPNILKAVWSDDMHGGFPA